MNLKNSIISLLSLLLCMTITSCGAEAKNEKSSGANSIINPNPSFWLPVLNKQYPDLELANQDGRRTRLSQFKGKVIIVEPIGMSCPACQAFAGANKPNVKPYGNCRPQSQLKSIDEILKQYGGISIDDPRIVLVQLLLYSPGMQAPSLKEGQAWAQNFGMKTQQNKYVLVGRSNMINQHSYNMIPGFQLIDKNFILRSDSTGHHPKNNLYTHLLPMVKNLL